MIPLEFSVQELDKHDLFLVMSSPSAIRKKNIDLIKIIIGNNFYVVVITANQPYDILKKSYEKSGIPLEKIFVIDTITRYAMGQETPAVKNCRFINNPANLTDIGIATTEMLKELQGKNVCLLFDSVNAMLIYISSQNITKFIHFVTSKLRLLNFAGIFLAVEKGLDPDLLVQLTTFVDEVIDFDEVPAIIPETQPPK
ncbi:MAG: hypothetical protein LUQ40_01410 [Methanomicrobiales archaeon]|nr:hypothetical protein [Methanomicrobiales archaeon]